MKVIKKGHLPRSRKGPYIFTFYSYKGGVGRSMALINIAALLARRGRRVLIIDLDLEAPGITYLAEEPRKAGRSTEEQQEPLPDNGRAGFVDAMCDLLDLGIASPLGNSTESDPFARYIHLLDLTAFAQAELKPDESICVHLMPAGDLSDSARYRQRLGQLSLEERYRTGEAVPLLEHFKNLLQTRVPKPFDFVLVDSRTGLSAEAGAAVRDLSEHLIVLMGLNRQNREGTEQFIRILRASEPRPESLTLVISPLPIGEDELADKSLLLAEASITAAWQSKKPLQAAALIPYHPRIALDERPHQRRRTNEHLSNAYARLLDRILWLVGESEKQLSDRFMAALEQRRWDDAAAALTIWPRGPVPWFLSGLQRPALKEELGKHSTETLIRALERFAASSVDAALICALHYQKAEDVAAAEAALERYVKEDRTSVARWQTAAEFWRENGNKRPQALAWLYRGIKALPRSAELRYDAAELLSQVKKLDSAEKRFHEALKLKPHDAKIERGYAHFLSHRRRRYREAEKYYLRSLSADPNSVTTHGLYANFLWDKRNRLDKAQEHYLKAIELDSRSTVDHYNLAELLVTAGRPEEARSHLQRAWDLELRRPPEGLPRAFFLASLILHLLNKDPSRSLGRLLTLFGKGFARAREGTTYAPLVKGLKKKLPATDVAFYTVLTRVLMGKAKVSDLRRFRRWRNLKPRSVEGPLFHDRHSATASSRNRRG